MSSDDIKGDERSLPFFGGLKRIWALNDRTNIGAQSYTYNGLGDRVRVDKPTGTRRFVYDAWGRVIAEYGASANDVKAEFIWALPPAANDNSPYGGGDHIGGYAPLALVAENPSNQLELYWVHGNHLGVPVVTTNAQGQMVSPGTDFLRPGFPGQSEVLADLYYNRARDYDPVTGRYIQADPIGLMGDVNPYVYAGSDPVNMIDPLGLFQYSPGYGAPAPPTTSPAPKWPSFRFPRIAPPGVFTTTALLTGLSMLLDRANCLNQTRMSGPRPNKWAQFQGSMSSPPSEEDCAAQWRQAREECRDELSKPDPDRGFTGGYKNVEDCARGRVSEECEGNPLARFLDPYTPRPPGRHSPRPRKKRR